MAVVPAKKLNLAVHYHQSFSKAQAPAGCRQFATTQPELSRKRGLGKLPAWIDPGISHHQSGALPAATPTLPGPRARRFEAGGNAADAAVAAAAAASIAEPLLCSLGGGALAIVHQQGKPSLALDAFTQTPRRRRVDALDFYPIIGNFGTDVQEFHVGLASIATPGVVAGLTALHQRFGRLPLSEALLPAIDLAGRGTRLNVVQRYGPMHSRTDCPVPRHRAPDCFGLNDQNAPIPPVGTRIANHELGSFLDCLGREGSDAFYHGEPARRLAADSIAGGGHLSLADLAGYRARWRRPLRWRYRDAVICSVPPPAFGGMMLNLALNHLATTSLADHEHLSPAYCRAIIAAPQSLR